MTWLSAPRSRWRRGFRQRVERPAIIELPPEPERPEIPHPGRHAQIFAVALAIMILGGAGLLASPWASESGESTPFVDALFTAVSAASVTGLAVVDTTAHWSWLGEAVILVLVQTGGLGFMVGASIVLQALRRGTTRLSDVLLIKEGAPTFSLREAAVLSRHIVVFTFATEAAGAAVLTVRFRQEMPLPEALWFGIFNAVTAFCNAGFVSLIPYRESIAVNATIMLLVQAGTLSYIVLADVAAVGRWARFALDTKLVLIANGVLLLGGALAFLALEWERSLAPISPAARPMAALFQSVAARSVGFATVDFAEVHHVTLFLWVAVMLAGGASGSTAGGVKLATLGVVVAAILSTLRGQEETQLFGRRIPTPLVFRAMAVIAVMLAVHFAATAGLAATESLIGGQDVGFIALMFETMSALATVGLSTGITPDLTTAGKLILCATMFFGRLGPLTVAYALQRRQRPMRYRLPATAVRIG